MTSPAKRREWQRKAERKRLECAQAQETIARIREILGLPALDLRGRLCRGPRPARKVLR